MVAPTVKLTAQITAIKGASPVTLACYFSATRPLEQEALDAFHASFPASGVAIADLPLPDQKPALARVEAALIALFDASVQDIEVFVAGDREPRPAKKEEVDGGIKIAMAQKLATELEVRLNEPGQ